GRDGEPADCALLWQKRDVGLLAHFIDQLSDSAEKERAWQRYHAVRRFAESGKCRHRQICLHFGETPKWESCGMCDVCGAAPDWLAGKEAAEPKVRRKKGAKPVASPATVEDRPKSAPAPPPDELREYMREWRRVTAQKQGVPAYVV